MPTTRREFANIVRKIASLFPADGSRADRSGSYCSTLVGKCQTYSLLGHELTSADCLQSRKRDYFELDEASNPRFETFGSTSSFFLPFLLSFAVNFHFLATSFSQSRLSGHGRIVAPHRGRARRIHLWDLHNNGPFVRWLKQSIRKRWKGILCNRFHNPKIVNLETVRDGKRIGPRKTLESFFPFLLFPQPRENLHLLPWRRRWRALWMVDDTLDTMR